MDKRERILELVKEGVLSVDEGLDLLESLSKKENEEKTSHDSKTESKTETEVETETKETETKETETEEKSEAKEEQILADELEAIANEINEYSVAIDALNDQILTVKSQTITAQEKLENLLARNDEKSLTQKETLEKRIVELTKAINQDDAKTDEKIQTLETELKQRVDALNGLEKARVSDAELEELEKEIQTFMQKSKQLNEAKTEKMKEMHSLKMREWTTKAKQFSDTIELPKGWREGANKTIDKAGELIDEGTQSLGAVLRDAAEKTKKALKEFDWDDMKIDLSLKEKASFEHEWLFEETTASILNIKNTSGQIQFKPSMNDNIKVTAAVKLYELAGESNPVDYFEEQATIVIDEDQFTFQIPGRKIAADLTIYLPARDYDYLRVESVNGDIRFDELLARDVYVKLTAGDVFFEKIEASMLEVKLSKGDVYLKNTQLRDLLINAAKGDIRVVGAVQSLSAKTVHGDLLLTLTGDQILRLVARSVNGDVKVSLPDSVSFEIEAKTTLGEVKSRLTASEKSLEDKEYGKTYRFFRMASGPVGQVILSTTKGNVLLKDSSQKEEAGE